MIFVTADLHGYSPDELNKLLAKADFGRREDDFLFILGDVIDRRGDGGVAMLRWLTEQPNVQLLLGNHEGMLLSCRWIFDAITETSIENLDGERLDVLSTWLTNGAGQTLAAMRELLLTDPDAVADIFDYLGECPLYDTVSVGERDFILVHAGLGNFSPEKKLSDYTAHELLWHRPTLTERYFDDATVVFGHTPTWYYGAEYGGKPVYTETWIDIDTGEAPTLLCLDDMCEYKINGADE